MIDLSKRILPDSVEVDGTDYKIKTDFRLWLSFGRLSRENPTFGDFDFLYAEWDGQGAVAPQDRKAGFEALKEFWNPKCPLPRPIGGESSERVVDFEQDADLIYAAFFQQYGIRLTTADLHWHEFLALFRGLKETKLNDVMGWRAFEPDNSKGMEKWNKSMGDLKAAWALESYFTMEDMETLEKFNARFE